MAYYELDAPLAIQAERSERAAFIRRTYAHLAGAILAFIALEFAFFTLVPQEGVLRVVQTLAGSPVNWLILMVAFIGAGYLARYWAHASTSSAMQYLGLGLYVGFWALIFIPILAIAQWRTGDATLIAQAGIMALCVFGGLSVAVLTTGKDFSFLGPILSIGGFIIFGVIVAAVFFPIGLGTGFCFLMVAFASACILYSTSNLLYQYRTDQHVGAALELFAAVALLFFYILRIFLSSRD
jgi:FtsH-binding integral membrane protein